MFIKTYSDFFLSKAGVRNRCMDFKPIFGIFPLIMAGKKGESPHGSI